MPTKFPVQVDYNHDLKPLEVLLTRIQRPGDFCIEGRFEVPMPKVEIDGVGVVSFPVPAAQIKEIIGQATRAPYGRGAETILDLNVRKVWQVDAAKVRIGGKSWEQSLHRILSTVASGLGCDPSDISAALYKLLVYEEGGFFKPHRDTEKSDGMFGTLVMVLPSAHRGGELILRHDGRQTTIDLSGDEVSELAFAAFYGDCEHEVRPVTQGSRICLDYNLVQGVGPRKGKLLTAPVYTAEVNLTADLLVDALAGPSAPLKIAWLLEHQYSPAGLSFSALKNADSARTKVLCNAASITGCSVHLGIVHIEEYGSAEPNYEGHYFGPSRWGYRNNVEGNDENEDADTEDFEIIEIADGDHFIDEWIDVDNRRVQFGRIPLDAGELIPDGGLDNEKPDKQRVMEASGNEGATFERSYHRAALVFWLRSRYAEVLLRAGMSAAIPLLKELVLSGEKNESSAVAELMLNDWESPPERWHFGYNSTKPDRPEFLELLCRLGDVSLVERFIRGIVTKNYDGGENAALVAATLLLGAVKTRDLFGPLVKNHMRKSTPKCVDLLTGLVKLQSKPHWKGTLLDVATLVVDGLTDFAKTSTVSTIADLSDSLGELQSGELRRQAAAAVACNVTGFHPVTVVVPALSLLHQRHGEEMRTDAIFLILWQHAAQFLLNRSELPPELPRDWKQDVTLPCRCEDCRELQAFAREPSAQNHRFRVRKDRRQHLHETIQRHDLDMTHVTERKGSPQTLVCTKTRRTYQRLCAQYESDRTAMAALLTLVPIQPKILDLETRLMAAGHAKN